MNAVSEAKERLRAAARLMASVESVGAMVSVADLDLIVASHDALEESVARLSRERQPLLEACQTLATLLDTDDWIATGRLAVRQAQAAIAEVQGEAAGS